MCTSVPFVFWVRWHTHECVAQTLDPSHLELISLLSHMVAVPGHRDTRAAQPHEHREYCWTRQLFSGKSALCAMRVDWTCDHRHCHSSFVLRCRNFKVPFLGLRTCRLTPVIGTWNESSVTTEVHGRLRWEDDWRGWFSALQHVIKARTPSWRNVSASTCGLRACVPAFHPDTDYPLLDGCVNAVREELNPLLRPLLSSGSWRAVVKAAVAGAPLRAPSAYGIAAGRHIVETSQRDEETSTPCPKDKEAVQPALRENLLAYGWIESFWLKHFQWPRSGDAQGQATADVPSSSYAWELENAPGARVHRHLLFEVDGIPERKLDKLRREAERLEKSSCTSAFCMDRQKERRKRGVIVTCDTAGRLRRRPLFELGGIPERKLDISAQEWAPGGITSSPIPLATQISSRARSQVHHRLTRFSFSLWCQPMENSLPRVPKDRRQHSRSSNLLEKTKIYNIMNKMDCDIASYGQEWIRFVSPDNADVNVLSSSLYEYEIVNACLPLR